MHLSVCYIYYYICTITTYIITLHDTLGIFKILMKISFLAFASEGKLLLSENMVCSGDIHDGVFACELTREIFTPLYQQTWEMRKVENYF